MKLKLTDCTFVSYINSNEIIKYFSIEKKGQYEFHFVLFNLFCLWNFVFVFWIFFKVKGINFIIINC